MHTPCIAGEKTMLSIIKILNQIKVKLFGKSVHYTSCKTSSPGYGEEIKKNLMRLQLLRVCRKQLHAEFENCSKSCEQLEETVAVTTKKHTIRLLLNQLNPLLNHRDDLEHEMRFLDREIMRLSTMLETSRLPFEKALPREDMSCYESIHSKERNTGRGMLQQGSAGPS